MKVLGGGPTPWHATKALTIELAKLADHPEGPQHAEEVAVRLVRFDAGKAGPLGALAPSGPYWVAEARW